MPMRQRPGLSASRKKGHHHSRVAAPACVAAVIGIVLILASACSSSGSSTASGSSSPSTSSGSLVGKRVVIIEHYADPSFWPSVVNGVKAVGAPYKWKISVLNSNGDASQEATNVTNVLSGQFDGVVIGTTSTTGSFADLSRLKNAGIPLVCVDSCATPSESTKVALRWTYTSPTDLGNDVGAAAVAYIKSKLGGKATIGVVDCDSLGPVCSDRHTAINAQLKALPGGKVVATVDASMDSQVSTVADMLTANPSINVIIANNEGGATSAIGAIKQMHLEGKVIVFGIDMTPPIAQSLLAQPPILVYSVGQDAYREGEIAAQTLIDKWRGQAISPFQDTIPAVPFSRSDSAAIEAYLRSPLLVL
jgi:ABC-type sugar transport system substrate-binding protein